RSHSGALRRRGVPRTFRDALAGGLGGAHLLLSADRRRPFPYDRAGGRPCARRRVMSLSIIIPVLDEAPNLVAALEALGPLRGRGAEVIVVDGGSTDETVALARPRADFVIMSARGRATQMNAGAAIARGEVLLFLHADTRLPEDADRQVADGLAR